VLFVSVVCVICECCLCYSDMSALNQDSYGHSFLSQNP